MKKQFFFGIFIIISIIFAQEKAIKPVPAPHGLRSPDYKNIITKQSLSKMSVSEGDTSFYIRDDLYSTTFELIKVDFYKKRALADEPIVIYVECAEYDSGNVTDADIDAVAEELLYSTPEGSYNPDAGILANELELFGDVPDVDNNDKLFVLLIDARDGYDPDTSNTYIAGYFDPIDQHKSQGNFSDIIYIDTYPARVEASSTLSIVAHELQHLIHYNYDTDEDDFINEGLSELAPIILGLPGRSFGTFLSDTNNPLAKFEGTIADYSKVGLWMYYLYNRFGLETIKQIVQSSSDAFTGIEDALTKSGHSGINRTTLLKDWFLANLLNDPTLEDGEYSYNGATIPAINSEHYYGNFTDGKWIDSEICMSAAEYIQFYSGIDIQFSLTVPDDSRYSIAVIRHKSTPEIEIFNTPETNFSFEDEEFGVTYSQITVISYWKATTVSTSSTLDYSFKAEGAGGYEEIILSHHDGVVDSDVFPLYLLSQGTNYEAVEKYELDNETGQLSAVSFMLYDEITTRVRIYNGETNAVLGDYSGIVPSGSAMTRFNLDSKIELSDLNSISISIYSEENSMVYNHDADGDGKAFLKRSNYIFPLSDVSVDGIGNLEGAWFINAIVSRKIETPPTLTLETPIVKMWDTDEATIKIRNEGTEALSWQIDDDYCDFLSIFPESGELTSGTASISLNLDRSNLEPGTYFEHLNIRSNVSDVSVLISIIERNEEAPQAGFHYEETAFHDSLARIPLQVFNIGTGASEFQFITKSVGLNFFPAFGTIEENDTVEVDAIISSRGIVENSLDFSFFDGLDTNFHSFEYTGELDSSEKAFDLAFPFPNPFITSQHSQTYLRATLTADKKAAVTIYNVIGQQVRSFSINQPDNGLNLIGWNGKNDAGKRCSSGVYLVRVTQGDKSVARKVLLLN